MPETPPRSRRLWRVTLALLLFGAGVALIPGRWCAREASRWYRGEERLQAKLARGVEEWVTHAREPLGRDSFTTGSPQFDGEWLFGTYLMGGLGFYQTARQHPEWRDRHAKLIDTCIDRLLQPEVRAFDTETWKEDAIDSLETGAHDHGAYLGYLNVLLSLRRGMKTDMPQAALNDRVTEALARRAEASPMGLLMTYPRETYPVDNSTVIASLAIYDRVTGADHRALRTRLIEQFRQHCIDPNTGLLYQCVMHKNAAPLDDPRGSGTALSMYFLSFADERLSRDLFDAVQRHLATSVAGFGLVREYPSTVRGGWGDIDSGPVLFGIGISPTGFQLAGCRIHGDPAYFSRLYATAYAVGAPSDRGGARHFVTGGPLGDAIMFAMLTAQPIQGDAR